MYECTAAAHRKEVFAGNRIKAEIVRTLLPPTDGLGEITDEWRRVGYN